MAKAIKVTDEGLKKLQDELEHLKTEGRKDIAEKIKVARGYGDLSENSEYDDAKNEQAKIEARIVELEAMLKNVEIIKDIKGAAKTVVVGVKVKVYDEEFDEEDLLQNEYEHTFYFNNDIDALYGEKGSDLDLLKVYLNEIGQFKLLTREEEIELANMGEEGRSKLVEHNLRLGVSIAKKYRGQGVSFGDLKITVGVSL